MSENVFIIGANGFIGRSLTKVFKEKNDKYDIVNISLHNNIKNSGDLFELCDITDYTALKILFDKHHPSIVINAAAMTKPDLCEVEREECWKVNVWAVEHLIKLCNEYNSHFIHFSSDFVFDGCQSMYSEEDEANPLSFYAFSKNEADNIISAESKSYSIIRTSLVYGNASFPVRSNFVTWVIESLKNNKNIRVNNDQFRSPTFVEDIAKATVTIAERNLKGIYNIAGPEFISVYDLAMKTAEVFELDKSLITPVTTEELNEKDKRPMQTGLNISKASIDFNFLPLDINTALNKMKNEWE